MRFITTFLLIIALAGCGFHLRGTQGYEIPAASVNVTATNLYSQFSRELERMLAAQGIELKPASGAEYSISILSERTTRRPVATSTDISVSEYELRLETQFKIDSTTGEALIRPTLLAAERIYSFDRSSLVGSSEEEEMLTEEMRRDIANQILRRFSAGLRQMAGTGTESGQ